MWFIGDITSLVGAVWANLVPTVIALSVYFCIADLVLVIQCLYYNKINAGRDALGKEPTASITTAQKSSNPTCVSSSTTRSASTDATTAASDDPEQQPLLSRRRSSDNLGLPGSHQRRRSSATGTSTTLLERRRTSSGHQDSDGTAADTADDLTAILEMNVGSRAWIKNTTSVLAICAAGAVGWFLAWRTRVWSPTPINDNDDGLGQGSVNVSLGAQILGYISALCYLGYVVIGAFADTFCFFGVASFERSILINTSINRARIPQIIKNQRDRSCEGLSLLFFLLSLLGNATFGAGVS